MSETNTRAVIVQIEEWYARAPGDLDDDARIQWVQHHAEIACPECGDLLFVLRTPRAENRGYYHLAMCEAPECSFQIDD